MQIHVHAAVFVSWLNIQLNYLNILQVKKIVWLRVFFLILVFCYFDLKCHQILSLGAVHVGES
jgi:hypothetical protein